MRFCTWTFVMFLVVGDATMADDRVLRMAELFAEAKRLNAEPARARRLFDQVAEDLSHVPGGAAVRRLEAQASLLAGNLPQAIEAYRLGLFDNPDDAALRRGLEMARSRVEYASAADRVALTPQDRLNMARWRLVRRQGIAAVALLSIVGATALGQWTVTRRRWLFFLFIFLELSALLICGLWFLERRQRGPDERNRLVVIRATTWLRAGDHEQFPTYRDHPLAPGVEGRLVLQSDRWLQIALADGTVGWIPVHDARVGWQRQYTGGGPYNDGHESTREKAP